MSVWGYRISKGGYWDYNYSIIFNNSLYKEDNIFQKDTMIAWQVKATKSITPTETTWMLAKLTGRMFKKGRTIFLEAEHGTSEGAYKYLVKMTKAMEI